MSTAPTPESVNRAAWRAARRRERRQERIERLLELARHLPPADRRLLEQVYGLGTSVTDLARLTRLPRTTLHQRIARLLRRLRHPLFRYVLAQGDLLPRALRATAEQVVVRGCSFRVASRRTSLSLHQVRAHVAALRALAGVGRRGA